MCLMVLSLNILVPTLAERPAGPPTGGGEASEEALGHQRRAASGGLLDLGERDADELVLRVARGDRLVRALHTQGDEEAASVVSTTWARYGSSIESDGFRICSSSVRRSYVAAGLARSGLNG